MTDLPPIRVEVPICAFRPYASREYQDTFPVPPPATVYGMLLSLLGIPREEKPRHRGTEIALGFGTSSWDGKTKQPTFSPELPGRSKVFRKLRRGADLENTRPDYQDLLLDLAIWVWLRPGADGAESPLSSQVHSALQNPTAITRSGGLSLGESSYLVDVVKIDASPPDRLIFLVPDESGFYSLPVWVDHAERQETRLGRFRLSEPTLVEDILPLAWVRVGGGEQ